MYHPVLGQVWLHPAAARRKTPRILLEEAMHAHSTMNRPGHLIPLRRYLEGQPTWPDAEVFRPVVEGQFVALWPLLLRRNISVRSMPHAPANDVQTGRRIIEIARQLARHNESDLTLEQSRRFALSAVTTILGAVVPTETRDVTALLDDLEARATGQTWHDMDDLETELLSNLDLSVRGTLWSRPWNPAHEPFVDRFVLAPLETMLANAMHAGAQLIANPQLYLPVLPSLNAVLCRRNDVPVVLVRIRMKRGRCAFEFEVLDHHQRMTRQESEATETLPAMETDEPRSRIDQAWEQFDDQYHQALDAFGSQLAIGDFAVAALDGLRTVARTGVDDLDDDLRKLRSPAARKELRHTAAAIARLSDQDLNEIRGVFAGYEPWLADEGRELLESLMDM